MLLGEFEHTVDDKSRLTLPAKFRQALAAGVVLTRGLDACLNVYPGADSHRLGAGRPPPPAPPSRREVVVVGLGDRLEIWDRAAWGKQLEEVKGSAEDVAERLAAKRD